MVIPTTYRRRQPPVPEAVCSLCGERDGLLAMEAVTQTWTCFSGCGVRASIRPKAMPHPVIAPSAQRFLRMHGYEAPEPPRETRLGAIARRIRG